MTDRLISSILEIKSNEEIGHFGKSAIKQAVISRLLSALGWDIFNIAEVTPEFSGQWNRVDFCLNSGENKVFIVVQEPGAELEQNEASVINFAISENAQIVLITNGISWSFFYPCKTPLEDFPFELKQKPQLLDFKFSGIDIFQNTPDEIGRCLSDYLSKISIESGNAFKSARMIVEERLRIMHFIDKAWGRLLLTPHDHIVKLLRNAAEEESGIRPNEQDVISYLKQTGMNMRGQHLKFQATQRSVSHKVKGPCRIAPKPETATDEVLDTIKSHPAGIDTASIGADTGFDTKKIRNIIYRLKELGEIKTIGRGIYIPTNIANLSDQMAIENLQNEREDLDSLKRLLRRKSSKIGIGE